MEIAVFDIETIPAQNLPDGVAPKFDPSTVKHGNTKDPEKRKAKEAQAKAIFYNGLDKTMSLHPDLCEVICFAGIRLDTVSKTTMSTVLSGEPQTIEQGWSFITDAYKDFVPLVSYNGIGFDLPVMLHRAMTLNIPVSIRMYNELTKRYLKHQHYDLMQILAGWDRQKWESLDFYLKRFGIGGKTGDGSQVYKMWKEGKIKDIEDYCKNDAFKTGQLFTRIEPWIVEGVGENDA